MRANLEITRKGERYIAKHRAEMDKILREIFANGGPMRPSYANGKRSAQQRSVYGSPHVCKVLEAEQRRLIRTWNE